MRAECKDPWWLIAGLDLFGFEDDDEESEDEGDEEESEEDEESENDDESDEEEDEDEESEEDEGGEKTKKNTEGLKSALRKERLARKKAERELRKLLAKQPKDDKDGKSKEDEGSESKPDPEEAARIKSLATKLRTNAIDTAILKFGDRFKSSDELLALVDRREIDVDQDEDDPSEIEVDLESVEEAVKALAKKSPHLLKTNRSGTKSGSKFGGKRKKSNEPSDEELRKKYAALRR